MKNNLIIIFILFINFFHFIDSYAEDDFNFDVTEIQVTQNGNLIKGFKRGVVKTNTNQTIITADTFEYNKSTNILNAKGNVIVNDLVKNYLIESDDITYFKDQDNIFSKGKTTGLINSRYKILSNDVKLNRKMNIISSDNKTIIIDESSTEYHASKFQYLINQKVLKGKNIEIRTGLDKSKNENEIYFFNDGIFNLNNEEFLASDTKIFIKKNSFDNSDNDPRIYGISSSKKNDKTILNKATFTSCKKDDDCPPWHIDAKKITHDTIKKKIIYDNAILKVYDVPVLYFPKFFHPDPSVNRQSGFLQPQLNSSNILGTSFMLPYYHVISDNKDLTIKPIKFDSNINMIQNEYRQKNKFSSFIGDFGLTKGYQSLTTDNKKKDLAHFFGKYDLDLNLDDFNNSSLNLSLQKTTNDTYLKVFDTNLQNVDELLLPKQQSQLFSELKLNLDHKDYNSLTGIRMYENLDKKDSDRYQYNLPYYRFSKNILKLDIGNLNFISSGDNVYKNTNNIRSSMINDFNFSSLNFLTKNGLKNKFELNLKNTNFIGKNDPDYKSSPSNELVSLFNFKSSLPMIKKSKKFKNTIEPKISFRINPTNMKNSSDQSKLINTNNIFSMNRLGLNNTLEEGKSITMGLNHKKENIENINKYFQFNLATIFRDKNSLNIPKSSGISDKQSNLFGSVVYGLSDKLVFDYDFSLDNDYKKFEYNSIGSTINLGNFNSRINFLEKGGKIGGTNSIENFSSYNFNDDNSIKFNTRRNRKIGLTEYYDLVYEYKNDCLTAGFKYRKSFYQDRDLKPSEDLVFTISIIPLTQYEQKIDETMLRNN
jgi:LPS-assembly protein